MEAKSIASVGIALVASFIGINSFCYGQGMIEIKLILISRKNVKIVSIFKLLFFCEIFPFQVSASPGVCIFWEFSCQSYWVH